MLTKKEPNEGDKCKACNKGKIVLHANKKIIGKGRFLCSNKDCDNYYICKSCGKQHGTH